MSKKKEAPNKVTLLFHSRIAGYQRGEMVELDDGPRVRRLLKSHFIELVDPPTLDWYDEPGTHPDAKPAEEPNGT